MGLLLSLLHLFALILVVRLTLSKTYVVLNPYAAAADNLLNRLLGLLRSALPLPPKGLCLILLVLTLSARAALLTKVGGPMVVIGGFAVFSYPAQGYLGWLGVEFLQFFYFYLSILAGVFLLRLWHLGRPLPGYTGDLITLAGRPFTSLPLWMQSIEVVLLAYGFVTLTSGFASSVTYPVAQLEVVKESFAGLNMPNLFDLSQLSPSLHSVFLTGTILIGVIGSLQGFIFVLVVALLIAGLLGSAPMRFFLGDALQLMTGCLPPVRLGLFDLSPIIAFLLFGVASTAFSAALLFIVQGLARVV